MSSAQTNKSLKRTKKSLRGTNMSPRKTNKSSEQTKESLEGSRKSLRKQRIKPGFEALSIKVFRKVRGKESKIVSNCFKIF